MKIRSLIIIACLASLAGCATYYERAAQTDCITTHWYEEGFDTAKNGTTQAQRWAELNSSCEKYNMWSDSRSFKEGYDLGLTEFCTRSNGFEFGQRNRAYSPICPSEQQAIFQQAYNDGESLYDATYNMETAISNLSTAESEISDSRARRKYLAHLIDSGDLDEDTEKEYVKERYNLKSSISTASSSLSGYRSDIASFTREQAALEYKLFAKYYNDDDVDDEHGGYSSTKTAPSRGIKLSSPAILLYKPEGMGRAAKSHYKNLANTINSYVSSTVDRSFRYQVVRNTELVFTDGTKVNGSPRVKSQRTTEYQHPTLLFWDGRSKLDSIVMTPDIEKPPLVELARFIQLNARDKILVADEEESSEL